MIKVKVRDYKQIKVGDLVEYKSSCYLILEWVDDPTRAEGFFRVFDLVSMKIKDKNFNVFKPTLFILVPSED